MGNPLYIIIIIIIYTRDVKKKNLSRVSNNGSIIIIYFITFRDQRIIIIITKKYNINAVSIVYTEEVPATKRPCVDRLSYYSNMLYVYTSQYVIMILYGMVIKIKTRVFV